MMAVYASCPDFDFSIPKKRLANQQTHKPFVLKEKLV
jgi:hypothetical protein